MISYLDRIFL